MPPTLWYLQLFSNPQKYTINYANRVKKIKVLYALSLACVALMSILL